MTRPAPELYLQKHHINEGLVLIDNNTHSLKRLRLSLTYIMSTPGATHATPSAQLMQPSPSGLPSWQMCTQFGPSGQPLAVVSSHRWLLLTRALLALYHTRWSLPRHTSCPLSGTTHAPPFRCNACNLAHLACASGNVYT